MFSLINLQFDPSVGLGCWVFVCWCRVGSAQNILQKPGSTNPHRSALNERQQALRSWLQQLCFSDSAGVIFTLYVWARSLGVFYLKYLKVLGETRGFKLWIFAVGSSYFISSSNTCFVCSLTEVFLPKVISISYLASNTGLRFLDICFSLCGDEL